LAGALACLLVAGCGQAPLAVCDPNAATTPHFVDATAAWGLASVTGNRIASADLDGDGYPDLVIHAIGSNNRETIGTPPKLVWVLMNRPNPAGGRMFVDATADSGFFALAGSTTQYRSAHLAVFADVDNDGDLDAFSGTYVDPTMPTTDTGDRSQIMLNDGSGHFVAAPPSAPTPPSDILWPTTSAAFTDANRDGNIDLFVGFWYESYGRSDTGTQAELYRGGGDGSFVYVTGPSGLNTDENGFAAGTNHRPAYGVTACDLNDDGAPELMISAYGRQWSMLYQNDTTGVFSDVGRPSGFAGDSLVDYSDNQFFLCACTAGLADPKCQGAPAPVTACPTPAGADWNMGSDDQLWRLNGNSFTTWCGDIDGDGKPDLYSAMIRHWWAGQSADPSELLVNQGNFSFTRPGNTTTGLSWPHPTVDWNEGALMVAGADFDGDGREDLYVAASDYPDQFGMLFHQKTDGTFEEVGSQWGLHHACASGLTVADFDRDGDLDVIVGSGTARDCSKIWKANEVHIYENQGGAASFLALRLVGGPGMNRTGIGAKVSVTVRSGKTIVKELNGGFGHFGQQEDAGTLFFGLGSCDAVESVTVRWPDAAGTTEVWNRVDGRRFIELRQGDPMVHAVQL
jgi:hypothetical protein